MYSIYIIQNKINNRMYIGKTNNFDKRIYRHLYELRNNKHHCIHLQRAWNKYGEENFTYFEALNNLTEEQVKEYEEYLIDKYYGFLYNVSKQSSGGDLISYHPNLDQIKEKHSVNGTKWWESKSEKEKEEFAEKFKGENNAMFGKTHSQEARLKISKVQKGRKMSEEQRLTVSKNQRKRFSDPKEREKVSERNRKRYQNPEERIKTSEANKKRYSDPTEREKMSAIGKKRYEKDYHVYMPNGEVLFFKNKCDIIEYFKINYNVGRWTIDNLIKTGEKWNPLKDEYKFLTGLRIVINGENK
jgi:group I intron endonuclease